MIANSFEWTAYEDKLMLKTYSLNHGFQVRLMIRNIRPDVRLLSMSGIEKRRKRSNEADVILARINDNIDLVEEYLLVAALIG